MKERTPEERGAIVASLTNLGGSVWLATVAAEIFGSWWAALPGLVVAYFAFWAMEVFGGWNLPWRGVFTGACAGVALGAQVSQFFGGIIGREPALLAAETFGAAVVVALGYTWWCVAKEGGFAYSNLHLAIFVVPTGLAVYLSPVAWWKTAIGCAAGCFLIPTFYFCIGALFLRHSEDLRGPAQEGEESAE